MTEYISQQQLAHELGVEPIAILRYRRSQPPRIPEPLELPGLNRVVAWPREQIDAWIKDLAAWADALAAERSKVSAA